MPLVEFQTEIQFYPISAKDQGRVTQFGTEVLPDIFMEYDLNAGGCWTCDLLIPDTEDQN